MGNLFQPTIASPSGLLGTSAISVQLYLVFPFIICFLTAASTHQMNGFQISQSMPTPFPPSTATSCPKMLIILMMQIFAFPTC